MTFDDIRSDNGGFAFTWRNQAWRRCCGSFWSDSIEDDATLGALIKCASLALVVAGICVRSVP